MNKYFIVAIFCMMALACNNPAKTETDEQVQRDSMDAAQRVKDSLEVEAKILQDMNSDTTGADTIKP